MPELPEVETIVRRLRTNLLNKQIMALEVLREKSFQGEVDILIDKKIIEVSRRAKIIHLGLENDHSILIHLKMTGQLLYDNGQSRMGGGHPTHDFVSSLPGKHTRIITTFSDQTKLYFNDMRVFGWWKVMQNKRVKEELSRYAPDVIDEIITADLLMQLLKRKNIPIKQAIMDSAIMSGVGNIYACDGLFEAGIDPRRPASSLSKTEMEKLLTALKYVINQGIELGGATIKNYVNVEGLSGGYQNVIRVYGKENIACPKCQQKIIRIKQGGRSTFFCSNCQK